MASTSKANLTEEEEGEEEEEEEDEEEEVQHFDDFTLASSWERFISEIEAICRQWLADGPKNLLEKGAVHLDSSKNMYKVKSELKHATKIYSMEYYFEINNNGKIVDWNSTLHDMQLCFGVKEFLVILPQSANGVVLDAPEASKLLSAVAIALSNCSSLWPAFVPVHDPSRKAYIGIQNMGTVFTRRFEADRIGSQVPIKFMHLEGLYELFVSKFAYSTLDHSMHLFKVNLIMKLTYQTLPDDDDDDDIQEADAENAESEASAGGDNRNRKHWDDDCPWSEWYSAENPVKGFDLITTWSEKMVENSLEMAEMENSSPHDAEKWILAPNIDCSKGERIGFASQLQLLVSALDMSFEVQFMEDFVSVETSGSDNLKSSMVIPPPTVLDRVLKDLFHQGLQFPDFAKGERKSSRAIKGAPVESLFAQFCLHSLWFGNCNIRAIAVLWIEFVREIRWCWEESQPLPKMSANGSIDLATCLINQKLQMLAICIEKKRELNEEFQDCIGSNDDVSTDMEVMTTFCLEDIQVREESTNFHAQSQGFDGKRDSPLTPEVLREPKTVISKFSKNSEDVVSANKSPSDSIRRGSAGPVGSMKLLKSYQSLHAPYTQDAPLMTEDMHEERLRAVEAFGDSFDFSAQLERDTLSSDMSSFKAANPDAVFEDFIRWHSPGDWENDESEANGPSKNRTEGMKDDWPPRGRLSQRMSDHGNLWRQIWNDAPVLPAYEQKPLLDPTREGEKILHYLETVRPHQLLEQMVCTAFRASADTLNQTNFGSLSQMTAKMDQLYITMASALRPLQVNLLSGNSETIEDLRRLCVVFEHVEKLLTLAASLHRKFLQTPRIAEAIFSDYYNFYLPTMGIGSADVDVQKLDAEEEFDMKLQLRMNERQVVSNMFSPPTANQSWRKVLSMGNLLNGHEPILREIIFSMRDSATGSHYAASSPRGYQQDIETYRMYIGGTSNDLRVALSVTSYD
ncbi:rab3 GTPase-activating protein catalytic subunit isoform X1 [Herrania umbratica]|uniref:Rab3 GTPase-activating protein catalytic subunit n=1 Tax=Herrania umbratica TaxID=108875 RepID=A0A6J0ZUW2_9ROSI|nr:rab3 GTPase-activating protein catalytic subunit isoform X1 [Herrania umbratica]